MKLGLMLGYSGAQLNVPVERVLRAEELGYDSVWTAEAYGSDATSPLAYLAALTKRIRLGTSIMQLAGRSPAMAAMQAGTIDALAGSPDRTSLPLAVTFRTERGHEYPSSFPYPPKERGGSHHVCASQSHQGGLRLSFLPTQAIRPS